MDSILIICLIQVCLFNIAQDPCELNNLVFKYPDIVRVSFYILIASLLYNVLYVCHDICSMLIQMLESTLRLFNATAVPPGNKPIDPRADPK